MKNLLLFALMFVLTVIAIDTPWIENLCDMVGIYVSPGAAHYVEPVLLILIYLKLREKK